MVYHADSAVAFAYVFRGFLIVPIGMIFGSHNSPSWFCQTAELRAHFADCLDFLHEAYEMEDNMVWAEPPQKPSFTLSHMQSLMPSTPGAAKNSWVVSTTQRLLTTIALRTIALRQSPLACEKEYAMLSVPLVSSCKTRTIPANPKSSRRRSGTSSSLTMPFIWVWSLTHGRWQSHGWQTRSLSSAAFGSAGAYVQNG